MIRRPAGYPPGVVGSLLVVLAYVACLSIAELLWQWLHQPSNPWTRPLVIIGGAMIFLVGWTLLTRGSWRDLLYPRTEHKHAPFTSIAWLIIVVSVLVTYVEVALVKSLYGEKTVDLWSPFTGAAPSRQLLYLFALLHMTMLMPLVEEIVFRGIIQRGLLQRYGALIAILISSLLFALMHLDVSRVPLLFLSGCLFGWLFYATGSIGASWLAHSVHNMAVAVVIGGADVAPEYRVVVVCGVVPLGVWGVWELRGRLTNSTPKTD